MRQKRDQSFRFAGDETCSAQSVSEERSETVCEGGYRSLVGLVMRTMIVVGTVFPAAVFAEESESTPPADAEATGAEEAPEQGADETPVPTPPPPPPETAPPPPPETAPPPPAASSQQISLMVTSDMDGALLDSPCTDESRVPMLPAVAQLVSSARGEGRPTFVIDAGDALFPSPLSNHLVRDESRARQVVDAFSSSGYDVMALGENSLTIESDGMAGLLGAARAGELPIVLSNIECSEEAVTATCEAGIAGLATQQVVVERSGIRVGVVNVVPEDLTASIRARIRAGAELTAPLEDATARVDALRADGADLVILVSNLDTSETAPRLTLDLLEGLGSDHAPDVVVAASTAQLVTQMQSTSGGTPVLTATPGMLSQVVLRREGERWVIEESSEHELTDGDPQIAATIAGWNREFCSQHDRPLAGGQLSSELDRAAFGQLVLRSMREQTSAEIAFINQRSVVDIGLFPLSGQLTSAKVHRALPNRTELRFARIKGADLTAIAEAVIDSESAYFAGIERDGDTILVNGREINADQRYRVVTTAVVARGGDGIIEADAAEFEAVGEGEGVADEALTDRVVRWVDAERGVSPYNVEEPHNLHRRVMWYGGLTLDAGMTYTTIRSDPIPGRLDEDGNEVRYNQAQLARQGVLDLRAAAELNGGLTARGHAWDNLLRLRYGMQHLETDVYTDEYADWAESVDLVSFRSAYDMDYLRDVVFDGAWYGPSLFLEYQLESEFNHDDDTTPHFLEMTGLLGLKLKPLDWLRFSVAFGVRSMITAPDPFPVPGLNLRAEMIRRRLTDAYPIYFAAFVDYFIGWPVALPDTDLVPAEGSAIHKFSAELRLEVALYGPLNLVGSIRGFVYDENPGSPATAFDATAGLSVALGGHRQTF